MTNFTYTEIANKYGENIARKAMENGQAEPTGRLIYPAFEPQHAGKTEWAADPLELENGDTIRAYWYLTDEEEQNRDYFDWDSAVEFDIE